MGLESLPYLRYLLTHRSSLTTTASLTSPSLPFTASGRGISISDALPSILRKFHSKDYRLIAQRYVERPLLIHQRKFDIRQWVLVTSVNPLVRVTAAL